MAPQTSKEMKDGYYTLYLKGDEPYLLSLSQAKAVFDDKGGVRIFGLLDGITADDLPAHFQYFSTEYEKWDFKTKGNIKVQPGESEIAIYNALKENEELVKSGFSCRITHYPTLGEYEKKTKSGVKVKPFLDELEANDCEDLPAIPEMKGYGGGKQYSDAGANETKRITARVNYVLEQCALYAATVDADRVVNDLVSLDEALNAETPVEGMKEFWRMVITIIGN